VGEEGEGGESKKERAWWRKRRTDGGGLADGLVLEEGGVLVGFVAGPGLVGAQGVVVLVLCTGCVVSLEAVPKS